MEPSVKGGGEGGGGLKTCTNGHGPLIKMASAPIYGKILKNLLLQNQEFEESFKAESWYTALWTQELPNLFK